MSSTAILCTQRTYESVLVGAERIGIIEQRNFIRFSLYFVGSMSPGSVYILFAFLLNVMHKDFHISKFVMLFCIIIQCFCAFLCFCFPDDHNVPVPYFLCPGLLIHRQFQVIQQEDSNIKHEPDFSSKADADRDPEARIKLD